MYFSFKVNINQIKIFVVIYNHRYMRRKYIEMRIFNQQTAVSVLTSSVLVAAKKKMKSTSKNPRILKANYTKISEKR